MTKASLLMTLVIAHGCGGASPTDLPSAEETAEHEGIVITVSRIGSEAEVRFHNPADSVAEVHFSLGGCTATFAVVRDTRVVWDGRTADRFCADVLGMRTLEPNEEGTVRARMPDPALSALGADTQLLARVETRPDPVWVVVR